MKPTEKQIFAYTHPVTPRNGYVGFVGAHKHADGRVTLRVRTHGTLRGDQGEFKLERGAAIELAHAILDESISEGRN